MTPNDPSSSHPSNGNSRPEDRYDPTEFAEAVERLVRFMDQRITPGIKDALVEILNEGAEPSYEQGLFARAKERLDQQTRTPPPRKRLISLVPPEPGISQI